MNSKGECFAWGQLDAFATGLKLDTLESDSVVRDARGKPRMLTAPLRLPGLDVSFIAAGGDHSIAITRDHKAHSWGFSFSHQTGQRSNDDIEVPTLIDSQEIRGKKFVWAGAGGQFSLLAEEATS